MATVAENSFEIERRVILFKPTTTMPDNSLLGYDGNPNSVVNGNTPGETLVYNCPMGTMYIQSNGDEWRKKSTPNNWVELGGGGGSSTFLSIETITLTALELAAGKIIAAHTIVQTELYSVNLNGSVLFSGLDYTIQNDKDIVFTFSQNQLLTAGDLVQIMYKY